MLEQQQVVVHARPVLVGAVGGRVDPHHQAAGALGPLRPLATAPDGVVEAVWLPGARFVVGVQGHPELRNGALFEALVQAAKGRGGVPHP